MGSGPDYPEPTQEERDLQREQVELLRHQRSLLDEQLRRQDLLAPFLYDQIGLEPQYNNRGTLIGFREGEPTAEEQAAQLQFDLLSGQARTQELIQPFLWEDAGLIPQYDEAGELTGFERRDDPLASLRTDIERQFLERSQAALAGELPLNPGLLRDLEDREADLRETLRRNLGPGYETSSPGIEALSEFQQQRSSLLDSARRGDLSLAEQLGLARQFGNQMLIGDSREALSTLGLPSLQSANALQPLASLGSSAAQIGTALGAIQAPFSGSAGLGALSQYYSTPLQFLQQQRQNEFAADYGQYERRAQLYGALIGSVLGAAGGYFGGPAGAQAGYQSGQAIGYGIA